MRAVCYLRVSSRDQGRSGLGLEAQRALITTHLALRDWTETAEYADVESGGKHDRVGLNSALTLLRRREADCLVVAKLDRLARSIVHVDRVLELARKQGWTLVALDMAVDTSTASGRMIANVLAAVAQWERDAAGERTRAALAARRDRLGGRIPGTRPALPAAARNRIRELAGEGRTTRQVAAALEAEGVPTAQGGRWHPGTVSYVLRADKAAQ